MKDCSECPDRPTCTELCPDMEIYANQDYVPRRERLVDEIESFQDIEFDMGEIVKLFTKKEIKVLSILVNGKKASDVSQELGISIKSARSYISRLRKKLTAFCL